MMHQGLIYAPPNGPVKLVEARREFVGGRSRMPRILKLRAFAQSPRDRRRRTTVSLPPAKTSTGVQMARKDATSPGCRRLAASLATAALALLGCLAIHTRSASVADEAPKPGQTRVGLKVRLRAQRERFLRLSAPLAALMKDLEEAEDASASQGIRTEGAKAAHANAKLSREVAEIALLEYTERTFPQELATVEGEQKLAEAELQRVDIEEAELRLQRTTSVRRAFQGARPEPALMLLGDFLLGDAVTRAQASLMAERIRLKQTALAREQADMKHKVLNEFMKPRRIRELKSDIEHRRQDELAREQTYDLEKKREQKIKNELSLRRRLPEEKRLLSILAEVVELEAKLPRDLADDARVVPTLDSIQAKLDDAERAAGELDAVRAEQDYAARASRVLDAAAHARETP